MGNKLQWCMYTNNNFAFNAVAKEKLKKEKKKKRDVYQEGVSPYHKFTKLNSLTGNISPAIHVCYRINGTRVEEGTLRQRERVCI